MKDQDDVSAVLLQAFQALFDDCYSFTEACQRGAPPADWSWSRPNRATLQKRTGAHPWFRHKPLHLQKEWCDRVRQFEVKYRTLINKAPSGISLPEWRPLCGPPTHRRTEAGGRPRHQILVNQMIKVVSIHLQLCPKSQPRSKQLQRHSKIPIKMVPSVTRIPKLRMGIIKMGNKCPMLEPFPTSMEL